MALLTTKGIYGLMAMLEIAKASEVAPITIKEISRRTGISKNYLEQILNTLRSAGFILSIKGKNGGYHLAKSVDDITFTEIFQTMENDYTTANVKFNEPSIKYFFQKCDEKLLTLFDMPLSTFEDYRQENTMFLDFII